MDTNPIDSLPTKLFLLGGGRHPTTKTARRLHRFERRVFRIGDVPIRPNRRKDVTLRFVLDHLQEVIAHIKDGTLIVQHDADNFVDVEEMLAIAAVAKGEAPATPIVKPESKPMVATLPAPPSDDEDDELPPTTPAPEVPQVFQPPQEDPAALKAAEDALAARTAVEEGPGEPEADEPAQDEPEAPVEAPMDEPVADEPEAPPADIVEAAPPDVEPEASGRYLPDGWQSYTKKDLLKLCEDRKITVDANRTSNKKLVELLQGWLAS